MVGSSENSLLDSAFLRTPSVICIYIAAVYLTEEDNGVPGENNRSDLSYWHTISHNVYSIHVRYSVLLVVFVICVVFFSSFVYMITNCRVWNLTIKCDKKRQIINTLLLNTVKPVYAVTSIQQSPVLKGHIFLVQS